MYNKSVNMDFIWSKLQKKPPSLLSQRRGLLLIPCPTILVLQISLWHFIFRIHKKLTVDVSCPREDLSPMSKLLRSSIGNVILPNESSFLTIPVLCITYSPLWRSVYFLLFYFLMTCCLCNVFVMTVVYHRAIHLSTKKWKVFFKMLGGVQTVILKSLLHFAVIFSFQYNNGNSCTFPCKKLLSVSKSETISHMRWQLFTLQLTKYPHLQQLKIVL